MSLDCKDCKESRWKLEMLYNFRINFIHVTEHFLHILNVLNFQQTTLNNFEHKLSCLINISVKF